MTDRRTWVGPVALLAICTNFVFLAGAGLDRYFNPDDATNLFEAWRRPVSWWVIHIVAFWKGGVRPVGQLFYYAMYWAAGWNPFPFRVVCLGLLLLNIALVWMFLSRLSKDSLFVAMGTLIASFHGAMWTIYMSTGAIYDISSQTFLLAGIVFYLFARRRYGKPALWIVCAVSLLSVLSFESKEMGFMLPAQLLTLEACFFSDDWRAGGWRWPLFVIVPACAIGLVGLIGLKLAGNEVHFSSEAYTPVIKWLRFRETTRVNLIFLTFKLLPITLAQSVKAVAASLVLACALRSRLMIFGWLFFFVGMLPLSFVTPREDGYVLYVPFAGVAIYLAALILRGLDLCQSNRNLRLAIFYALSGVIVWTQWKESGHVGQMNFGPGGEGLVHDLSVFAPAHCSTWAPGARLTVVDAPFGKDYMGTFVLNLACHRTDLKVDSVTSAELAQLPTARSTVIQFQSGTYRLLP